MKSSVDLSKYEELLQLAKDTPITQSEIDEFKAYLEKQDVEFEKQQRLNYSIELMNRTYNL